MSNKLLSTVLHHHVLIRRRGQIVSFQITIPRDVVRIVGIETGIRNRYCRPLMPWRRDQTGGLLSLRATGDKGVFYSSYVKVQTNTMIPVDLGYNGNGTWIAGFGGWDWLVVNAAAHSGHREPDILDITAPRVLHGTYTDTWGIGESRDITYRLSIYLWVTVNDLYNTPEQCMVQ